MGPPLQRGKDEIALTYLILVAGLGYPMNNRDTKEYDMKVEELLEGKNDVYAFEGTRYCRSDTISCVENNED